MNITIVTVGKKHDPSIEEAIRDFSTRISHYTNFDWRIIPAEVKDKEGEQILKAVEKYDHVILLDELGKALNTVEFSNYICKLLNESIRNLAFVIGGAYRVSEDVKKRVNYVFSISKLTLPHQLVRLILAEQIYRSFSIIKGEKYHHA